MEMRKTIFEYIKMHKKRYIIGIFSLIFVDALQIITPKLFGMITDYIKSGMFEKTDLFYLCLLIAVIALFIAIFRFIWRYNAIRAAKKLMPTLKTGFMNIFKLFLLTTSTKQKQGI